MPLATPHPYTLQLPAFEGPLDLLLRLIEKQELEITAISLALVADQYLAHVRALRDPDPLAVAEFLALAAQLLLIKSRALLPRPEAGPAAGDELSGDELARRLREYQRFKQAAGRLRAWEAAGLRMRERSAPPVMAAAPPPLAPQQVTALVAAIQRRLRLLEPPPAESIRMPKPRELTIADVSARIHAALERQPWMSFIDLLDLSTTRAEVIVALWTVLELFKRQVISVEQPEIFEQISLGRGPRFGEGWGLEAAGGDQAGAPDTDDSSAGAGLPKQ